VETVKEDKVEEGSRDVEGEELELERAALRVVDNTEFGSSNVFNMFSDSPSDLPALLRQQQQLQQSITGQRVNGVSDGENPHLQGNYDDSEGYYKPTIGERVSDRYRILGIVGKGVFSSVLKCIDERESEDSAHRMVAIKMIRNNETMRKAAEKEKQILMKMSEQDPHGKRFCVRMLTHCEYRQHIALVFEFQAMNLRETLKKFGKDVGIAISAIRIYGRQLFVALRFLAELRIVHADIKLDNILISENLKTVKLCDFGSAFFETDMDNDPTPYLVSRFYRAPEIILGLNCEWVCCCVS
jgi:serine/threonine-protein kinase PRP4